MTANQHPTSEQFRVLKQRLLKASLCRKEAVAELRQSQSHYARLLADSQHMQERLRHLTHQLFLAQEEDRKHISRELHDDISQILSGINIRLAALKLEASNNSAKFKKTITQTQQLLKKSVDVVHRFARQLRPAMIDDLGLIPTIRTFIQELSVRSALHIDFEVTNEIENLDNAKKTALYRIVQEALTNVIRHAQASKATLNLAILEERIHMSIYDNGPALTAPRKLTRKHCKELGILGMRERAEMLAGSFEINAIAGKGTTIHVSVPLLGALPRHSSKRKPS